MTDDIVAFIRQRLEDDERMARACGDGVTWSVMHRSDWRTGDSDALDPDCAASNCDCCGIDGDNADSSAGMRIYDEGGHDNADAEHIARHDPARVLREVEAKRRILAFHRHLRFTEPLDINSKFEEDRRPAFDEAPRYVGCEVCSFDSRYEEVYPSWWCAHVRLLALPHADHPDYRTEWSPS